MKGEILSRTENRNGSVQPAMGPVTDLVPLLISRNEEQDGRAINIIIMKQFL